MPVVKVGSCGECPFLSSKDDLCEAPTENPVTDPNFWPWVNSGERHKRRDDCPLPISVEKE